jgi:hypothetical protein
MLRGRARRAEYPLQSPPAPSLPLPRVAVPCHLNRALQYIYNSVIETLSTCIIPD